MSGETTLARTDVWERGWMYAGAAKQTYENAPGATFVLEKRDGAEVEGRAVRVAIECRASRPSQRADARAWDRRNSRASRRRACHSGRRSRCRGSEQGFDLRLPARRLPAELATPTPNLTRLGDTTVLAAVALVISALAPVGE